MPRVVAIKRIALFGGHEHQPRGRRHLDHGGLTVAQQAEPGDNRLAQRAGHLGLADRAAGRRDQGVDRPFAAVGHRHLVDRCARASRRPRRAPSPPPPRAAVRLPLNLSGAITTRMVAGPAQARRPLARPPGRRTSRQWIGLLDASILDRPRSVQRRRIARPRGREVALEDFKRPRLSSA